VQKIRQIESLPAATPSLFLLPLLYVGLGSQAILCHVSVVDPGSYEVSMHHRASDCPAGRRSKRLCQHRRRLPFLQSDSPPQRGASSSRRLWSAGTQTSWGWEMAPERTSPLALRPNESMKRTSLTVIFFAFAQKLPAAVGRLSWS